MRINEKQKIIAAVLVFTLFTAVMAALNYFRFEERGTLLAKIDSLQKEEKKAGSIPCSRKMSERFLRPASTSRRAPIVCSALNRVQVSRLLLAS